MNINIFQFLKQGTSLNRDSLSKNKKLQEQIQPSRRASNKCYTEFGKFQQSDSEMSMNDELNQQQLRAINKKKIQQNRRLCKMLQIKTQGLDIPFLISNFTKLFQKYNIPQQIAEGIAQIGFRKPTPVQMQSIPSLIQERNTLVTAPTGTGKTLAFSVPILHKYLQGGNQKKIFAVILTPLQQLSTQIMEQLEHLRCKIGKESLKIQCISKLSQKQRQKVANNKFPGVNILVSTPLSFINIFSEHRKVLKGVKYLILDQCDKYFEQSFLDQIRTILQMFNSYKPIYGLFSATIQHPVEQLLKSQFLDYSIRIEVGGKNKVLHKINQKIQYCTNQYGKIVHLQNLISEGELIPPAIIFVQQKKRARQLYFEMKKINSNSLLAGIDISSKIQVLTSDKSKQQRQQILSKFQSGHFWILITTDIVARGIDFKTVNFVINYDFPNSILTYIHRVGRTGRAERNGKAITMFTDEDKPVVRSLANLLNISGCEVPDWILEMPKPKKSLKRKLQKNPVKRLPVGVSEGIDKQWENKLDKMDKRWKQKKQKQKKSEQKEQDQGQWIQC